MSRCKYLYSQEILMLFFPLNLCPIDFINAIIVIFHVQNCAVKTTCVLPRLYNPSIVFKVLLSQFLPISLLINYALANLVICMSFSVTYNPGIWRVVMMPNLQNKLSIGFLGSYSFNGLNHGEIKIDEEPTTANGGEKRE